MSKIKGFGTFLDEGKKQDSKKKKAETKSKKKGKDDAEYMRLMDRYKRMRAKPHQRKEASDTLDEAQKLGREGDVSRDAKMAAAYL